MSALSWAAVALVFFGLEIATAGFWFMWLGIAGAVVALFTVSGLITSLSVQCLIFAIVSLILVIFTRPLLLKFIHVKDTPSNMNALVGRTAIVLLPISPLEFGQVKVNGEIWTAAADMEIAAGQQVTVIGIDGVKLRVEPNQLSAPQA